MAIRPHNVSRLDARIFGSGDRQAINAVVTIPCGITVTCQSYWGGGDVAFTLLNSLWDNKWHHSTLEGHAVCTEESARRLCVAFANRVADAANGGGPC